MQPIDNGLCCPKDTPGERRKRLPEEDRRRLVMSAAEGVFCEKGFAAATMDDVAQAAGMSKKTLYTLFDSKIILFRELLQDFRARQETLNRPPRLEGSAQHQLTWYLEHIQSVAMSGRKIALHRMVIREALIAPDLADLFMEVIIDPGPLGLVSLLERLMASHDCGGITARDAAEMLLGMAFGVPHHKLMINERYQPDAADSRRRIQDAVGVFVKGMGLDTQA